MQLLHQAGREEGITSLFAGLCDNVESEAAAVGDGVPVSGGDLLFGEELRAHSDAGSAGFHPRYEILFGRFHSTCCHDLAPGHRRFDVLHERRSSDISCGEDLADIAAGSLSCTDLRDGAAAGNVRDQPAVADGRYLRIVAGTDDEVGAQLDVERCGGRIDDGAGAEDHIGTFLGGIFVDLFENLVGIISAIGEFEDADAAVVAGFHHLTGDFGTAVVENGNHSRFHHCTERVEFIESCHGFYVFGLSDDATARVTVHKFFHLFDGDLIEIAVNSMFQTGGSRCEVECFLIVTVAEQTVD